MSTKSIGYRLFCLFLFILFTGFCKATTATLSFEDFDIKGNEEKELVIDLTNPSDEITLVQFDLRLPSGLSLKQTGNEYDIDMLERTSWRKHSLDANATDGIIRFLLASSSNTLISGTSGAIIRMTIVADDSFTKGVIRLENILLVNRDEKEIKPTDVEYSIGDNTPNEETPEPQQSSAYLRIEPFSIATGETTEMTVDLINPMDELTLVQFDLRLPTGLSLKQSGSDYDINMCDRTTWRKHSLDANATNGIIRFLLASSSNTVISGTEGAIIKMVLIADKNFNGGKISLENVLLVSPDQKEIKPTDYVYSLASKPTIETAYYFTGSINGWNNSDTSYKLTNDYSNPYDNPIYTCRIPADNGNRIEFKMTPESGLGGDWTGCLSATINDEEGRFAYNNEGGNLVINPITDAMFYDLTFNMLEQTWGYEAVYAPISKLSIENFAIVASETKEMFIDLTNPEDELTLVQFDMHLPTGLNIKQTGDELVLDMCDRTTWRKHTLDANKIGDGCYRFLLYSSSNELISGTEGALIKMALIADNDFDYRGKKIIIDNILLVSPEQDEIKPNTYEYALPNPSDINAVFKEVSARTHIYSLSGQRLDTPRKGINIVNGKKVIVK